MTIGPARSLRCNPAQCNFPATAPFNSINLEEPMPAKSQAQQKAAGAALSAKRGETKVGDLKGASRSMEKSMSEQELHDMASSKRKGKPQHNSQK